MLDATTARAPSAGRLPDPELVAAVDNLPIDSADRFSFSRDFMTMRRVGFMQAFPSGAKRNLQKTHAQQEIGVAQAELRKTRFETAQATSEAWIASAIADESRDSTTAFSSSNRKRRRARRNSGVGSPMQLIARSHPFPPISSLAIRRKPSSPASRSTLRWRRSSLASQLPKPM
jgi:hypothetical protein